MRVNLIPFSAALLFAAGFATPAIASELADKGREIFNKNQHAVVTVEIVLKQTYSQSGQTSGPRETKQSATGTVVDSSGLTVLALSACDPGDMYQRMQPRYKVETEVTDVNILLADGTELPAEIVLRDKDLDLAFLRPKVKPATPMSAVDLSQSAPAQVLDELITLNRLNKAASRAYAAGIEHVAAVVQKPRTFYVPESNTSASSLGSPAFQPNGKLVGVLVLRAISSDSGGNYNYNQNVTSIILPADAILKAAKQAPEAKAETREAPKETEKPKDPAPAK
ncbi:MAG TPA: serine protease [Verrucomicrobiae bacterium]|nr:serine protease [Verrucomicrobiae bacterium]